MCFLGFIRYNQTFSIACGFRKYENLFTHEYHIPLGRFPQGIWYSWVNITEILLKVALNTKNQKSNKCKVSLIGPNLHSKWNDEITLTYNWVDISLVLASLNIHVLTVEFIHLLHAGEGNIIQDKNHIREIKIIFHSLGSIAGFPPRVIVLWQENVRGTRNASLAAHRCNGCGF
jgi:hypothetical protein